MNYFSLNGLSRRIYIFTTRFVSSKRKYSNPKQNIKANDLLWYIYFTRAGLMLDVFSCRRLAAWLEESEVPQLLPLMSWTKLRWAQPGISLCRDAKYQICVTINKPYPHELVEWTPLSSTWQIKYSLLLFRELGPKVQCGGTVMQCEVSAVHSQSVYQKFSQSGVLLLFILVQTDCSEETVSCTLWKSRRKLMLEALSGAHRSACETIRLQTKQANNLQSLIIIPAWFVLIWVRREVVKGGYMSIVCGVKRPVLMWFIISVAPRVSSWFERGFPVVCGSVCLVNTEKDGLDRADRHGCITDSTFLLWFMIQTCFSSLLRCCCCWKNALFLDFLATLNCLYHVATVCC